MSVTLTQEQRAAIEARGQIIVSASAGSGKTFVMIERLVALVLGGADVRSILAVTFTNKAAAQMRDRLRLALIKGISEREGAEKERLKAQLAALPLAEISTIHAFCGRLIRTYFYAAGVDPAFRIVDGDDADGTPMEKWDVYTKDSPACMGFRDMPKAEIQHVSELEEFLIASQIK